MTMYHQQVILAALKSDLGPRSARFRFQFTKSFSVDATYLVDERGFQVFDVAMVLALSDIRTLYYRMYSAVILFTDLVDAFEGRRPLIWS